MGRTAQPATPGTQPNADASDLVDDLSGPAPSAITDVASALTAGTPATIPAELSPAEQLAAQQKQIDDLKGLVQQLSKNQASATSAPVELPTMAEAVRRAPSTPMLTQEGWLVPAIHPTDRVKA